MSPSLFGDPDPPPSSRPCPVKGLSTYWDALLSDRKLLKLSTPEVRTLSRTFKALWEVNGFDEKALHGIVNQWFKADSDGERMGFRVNAFIGVVRTMQVRDAKEKIRQAREADIAENEKRKREKDTEAALAPGEAMKRLAELRRRINRA